MRTVAILAGLVLIVGIPRSGWAQQGPGEGAGPGVRGPAFQVGGGIAIPMSHLAATKEIDDGYATPGATAALRFFYPVTGTLDFMVDLALPRFGMDETQFERGTSLDVSEPKFRGNALSMGTRWFPYRSAFGDLYLLATGGMYHLVFDGFIGGVLETERGAYRLGGSVGGGFKFHNSLTDFDVVVRYHRFTDTGTFGLGDLTWLEIGLAVDMEMGRDR